jgi:hypothetical protein
VAPEILSLAKEGDPLSPGPIGARAVSGLHLHTVNRRTRHPAPTLDDLALVRIRRGIGVIYV